MDLSVPTAAPAPPNPPPPNRLSMTAHDAKTALRHGAKARRAALHEEIASGRHGAGVGSEEAALATRVDAAARQIEAIAATLEAP